MALTRVIAEHPLSKYLVNERLPHAWCPGCGLGITLGAILRAVDRKVREGKIDIKKLVLVSGIGCSARASFYVRFDSAHTIHGRAIPFATGAKLANPSLEVIVFGGDGDIAGIGGNHLIHAARRNMDLLVFMVSNLVYAMTGGQVAPTTPTGLFTTTTPYGNPERPINVVKLVASQNPNYVARASATHPALIEQYTYRALGMEGFRFIEVISMCPEVFGRHIGYNDPVSLYKAIKSKTRVKARPSLDEADYDWNHGWVLGEFIIKNNPGYLRTTGRWRA